MIAAVYRGPRNIEVSRSWPVPPVGPGDVLVGVRYTAVCGGDLRVFKYGDARISDGRILGHEIAGDIVEVGSSVSRLEPGQRVAIAPNFFCGSCVFCAQGKTNHCTKFSAGLGIIADGGFAEYVLIPEVAVSSGNVVPLPDSVSYEDGALIEPLSCVLTAVTRLHPGPGDFCVVFGAGPMGLLHMKLLKLYGVDKVAVVDTHEERLRRAEVLGADIIVNSAREDVSAVVSRETRGLGANIVVTARSSGEAQVKALEIAGSSGRVCFFAGVPQQNQVPLNPNLIHYKSLAVVGSTRSTNWDFRKCLSFVAGQRIVVRDLVTGVFPLVEIGEAFRRAATGDELKVLIDPCS